MPIYEYRCQVCHRNSSVFLRSFQPENSPACGHCGSAKLTKLFSSFAVLRGSSRETTDLDDFAPGFDDMDTQDPSSMARWMRKAKEESGEDLGPEFDDVMARVESGELPQDLDDEDGFDSEEG